MVVGPAGADAGALPAAAVVLWLVGVPLVAPTASNCALSLRAVPSGLADSTDADAERVLDGATRIGYSWSPKVISMSSSVTMVRSARSVKSVGSRSCLIGLKAGRSTL
eukprot:SAG11_NODE_8861_length_968_cov_87.696203_1_plen_108_part_00